MTQIGGLIAGVGDFGVTELVTQAERAKESSENSAGIATEKANEASVSAESAIQSATGTVKRYTIAQLRLLSPNVSENPVYFSTDAGKEGFWKIKAGSSEADNLGNILVCANGVRLGRIIENGEVHPEWFGAVGDGVTNDYTPIQLALDYTLASDNLTVRLSNKNYKINSRIVIDSYHTSIRGNCLLDFTSSTTGGILAVASIGSEGGASYGKKNTISGNIRIKGSGATNNQVGIEFNSPIGGSNPNLILQNVSVFGFQTGVSFKNRAYNMLLQKCEIFSCGTCVDMPSGFEDYGEKITFVGCVLYNSLLATKISNPNGSFHFISCSFDYNQRQFDVNQGRVFLSACHVESSGYASPPITVQGDGGYLYMNGGWLLCTGVNNTSMCNISTPSIAKFENVFINNIGSAKYFNIGSGKCVVSGTVSYSTGQNPSLIGISENTIINPDFEQTSGFIDGMIIGDTAPITTRTQGANMKMTVTTSQFQTGTKSLFLQKSYGGGSQAQCSIFGKIKEGSIPLLGFSYRKPNTNTGNIFYTKTYYNITEGAIPTINRKQDFGSALLDVSIAESMWANFYFGEPKVQAPTWATHVGVEFNFDSFNGSGEGIYIDNFEVNSY